LLACVLSRPIAAFIAGSFEGSRMGETLEQAIVRTYAESGAILASPRAKWTLLGLSLICHVGCFLCGLAFDFLHVLRVMPWYFLWVHYFLGSFTATFTHYLGHKYWTGRWFRAHTLGHHGQSYPAKNFLRDKIAHCGDDNRKYYAPAILFPGLVTWYLFGSWQDSIVSSLYIGVLLSFVNDIHEAYHLRGHWLERFQWFHVLRAIHLRHHQGDMLKNYGIVDFMVDTLASTIVF